MDIQLATLISDYQSSVRAALVLMQRSGIQMPYSNADWISFDIPERGKLEGGIPYFKHGFGCEVQLPEGSIDFDFGEKGEIDGFDLWRLTLFCANKLQNYGFATKTDIRESFATAIAEGSLLYSGHALYYAASTPRIFAFDVENRSTDDKLPGQNQDSVLVLHSHYFLIAQLMKKNYKKLDRKLDERKRLSVNDELDWRAYLSSWLGFLAVTCEGFKKLGIRVLLKNDRPEEFQALIPQCDALVKMMNKHSDSLKQLRNKTFHLRDDASAVLQFFDHDAGRLSWAAELHADIERFFSKYRILCEVHYARNNRISEISSRRIRRKHRSSDRS